MLLFSNASYADEYEVVVAGTIELLNPADPDLLDHFDLHGSNFELRYIYDTDAPLRSGQSSNPACTFSSSSFWFVEATYSFTNRPNGAQDVVAAVGSNMPVRNAHECSQLVDYLGFPQGSIQSPDFVGLRAGNGAALSFANTYFPGTDPVTRLPVVDPADVVGINFGPYVFFSNQHGSLYNYASANLVSITAVVKDLGDVNLDGSVNFADIPPFIVVLGSGVYQREADLDQNGTADFFDISPFIAALQDR